MSSLEERRDWLARSKARKAARLEKREAMSAGKPTREERDSIRRGQPIPEKTRREIEARSAGLCEIRLRECAGKASEIHHRKNRSQGGSNDPKNLLNACRSCHHQVTIHADATVGFRTKSYQSEGTDETGLEWQPEDKRRTP